ncbi:hypothetical protein [Jiella marina]|nr:hypothetical protein [Jiella sp. LLJ827]MCQ0986697.1 hypothetical protein [Jiella sp. LLJ827]
MLILALSMMLLMTLATATAIVLNDEREEARVKVLAKDHSGFRAPRHRS